MDGLDVRLDEIEAHADAAMSRCEMCGYCDAGLPMSCTCSPIDPRQTIMELVANLQAQTAALRSLVNIHRRYRLGAGQVVCDNCTDSYGDYIEYPCPTIRTITEAMEA